MSQGDFFGGEALHDELGLGRRQHAALDYLDRISPEPAEADEVGASFHAHGEEHRCEYCAAEGRVVLGSLERHGLVVKRGNLGWVRTPQERSSA